jgi:hypothetical protein
MQKVNAFIETGSDGTYGVYVDLEDTTLNYGIHGEGNTAAEAIEDFKISYEGMKLIYLEQNKPFVETNFIFEYDVASFLTYYGGKI